MVQVIPPKVNLGSIIGEAAGQGLQKGMQRGFETQYNRGMLQSALGQAQKQVKAMEASGKYSPSELFFALAGAGAGIPGWAQTVSEAFPVLSRQVQNQMILDQRQGRGGEVPQVPMQPSSQVIANQQFDVSGTPTSQQFQRPSRIQQIPGQEPLVEGQAGVPTIKPESLANKGASLYQSNLAAGMDPQQAMANAISETGLTQQDIQNEMEAAKVTQQLTKGQKGLSESFKNLALPEIRRMHPGLENDAQAENEFWRMSEEFQGLSDPQRIARTLDKWVPWYNEKKAVDNVMTPNLIQRYLGQGKGIVDQLSRSIKPFVSRGRAEQEYALSQLTRQGLALPEAYEAVYPTSPKINNVVKGLGRYPGLSKASPFNMNARKSQLEKEGRMIEDLSKKLPKIVSEGDSLISILYNLMKEGWTQQAYVQALDMAKGLKLSPRQESERVQLGQDMTPGFWDILKMPGVF